MSLLYYINVVCLQLFLILYVYLIFFFLLSPMVSNTFSTLDWSLMDSWLSTFMVKNHRFLIVIYFFDKLLYVAYQVG